MALHIQREYKLFSIRLVIFLLIFFSADFLIGGFVRYLYFSQKIKYTYGIEQTKADVIIVGSSRAENHYVPSIFHDSLGMSCYNMGSGGQNIFYDYGVIKSILDRYTPKIFIIDLMDIDIKKTGDTYNTDKLNVLLPYYKDHESIREVIALRGPVERIKLLSQIYPFNSQLTTILYSYFSAEHNARFIHNGYIPLEGNIIKNQTHNNEISENKNKEVDPLKIEYIEKIITLCKSRNVKLIMITSPWYNKLPDSQQASMLLQNIASKYGAEYWDYSQDSVYLLNETMFKDLGHLNHQGASLFTKLVASRIKILTNNYTSYNKEL